VSEIYDGDAPYVEYDGAAVSRIKWVESGLGVEYADGDFSIVPEDSIFLCGMSVVRGRELHLIFGEWVSARTLRFGGS
jgi:hypothetical protein